MYSECICKEMQESEEYNLHLGHRVPAGSPCPICKEILTVPHNHCQYCLSITRKEKEFDNNL